MSMGNGEPAKPDVESGPPPKPEREATKKIIRVLTVLAYLSSVSTAAIMLSLYYIFLWNPMPTHAAQTMPSSSIPLLPNFPNAEPVKNTNPDHVHIKVKECLEEHHSSKDVSCHHLDQYIISSIFQLTYA